ncbi:hypothetical protein [Amycolatopsis sp. cmx-11-51]|uniref:hypothetical protein n=1 Tax=unclassified Amycolatopsis TaxID=2618356 RepID=UPI0039E3BBEC
MTSGLPGGSKTPWEDVLNYFTGSGPTGELAKMPLRETILNVQWLKWDVWSSTRHYHGYKPKGWDYTVNSYSTTREFWAAASANYEAFGPVMTAYYGGLDDILDSMNGYYNTNPVAQPSTFTKAFNALNGTKSLLAGMSTGLGGWRDKVGKKGDDFQGTGAGAFRDVLDGLVFRCDNLVSQLGTRPDDLKTKTPEDNLDTKDVNEAAVGLRWAFDRLHQGYAEWMSPLSVPCPTAKFDSITVPGNQLAWPGGCLTAIWNSPKFTADLKSNRSTDSYWGFEERYPKSDLLGADARSPAFWEGIMEAAKGLWTDHIERTLDVAANAVLKDLPPNYSALGLLLPQIREPRRLNLHKPPPTTPPPPPGSQTPPPPPGSKDGPPKPPPGPKDGPPKIPDPTKGDKDTKGPNGPNGPKVPVPPPVDKNNPLFPNPNNPDKPPPVGPKPDDRLKVPSGSTIRPDGVVLGPDKKPLLDPFGRQVVVPPGSRIGPNGDIIGPKGDKLTEKDRLARPDPIKKDGTQQNDLDQYLKSLRGNNAPSIPTLLPGTHSPVSLSSGGPLGVHSGFSGSAPHPGSIGSAGDGKPETTTSPPGKPVTTEGGPSLVKNQQSGGAPQNGMGGVPFYPPTAGGAGAGGGADQNKGERDRTTWLAEDEETWGTDPKLPPSVLGARKRGRRLAGRGAGGPNNYGQGGNDGRLAGGATSPGYGHAEGSA